MYIHDRLDPNERFRERRRQARRRKRARRAVLICLLIALGAGLGLGATKVGGHARTPAPMKESIRPHKRTPAKFRALPKEVRGIHLTMGLASLPGKLDDYLALTAYGLNTIELDVKDENGYVGFVSALLPALARRDGAVRPYYNVHEAVQKIHARGAYLIGRVVVYEDPTLTASRPDLAILRTDGSIWRNNAGLGWSNPYDKRVWAYNVSVAAAAARAGFDEIQFDYVRFPSDGDLSQIVYPSRRREPKGMTIAHFLAYAAKRLHPLGVRVSADVFGLSAHHDLGIGQVPTRIAHYLDAIYPMVYPSHYTPGEYNVSDPNAYPGRIVADSLYDFRRAVRGTHAKLIPWLQDFSLGRTYTLTEVGDQIAAARRQHAAGFMLWNPEGIYTQEALSAR
jgi:hypothetical protein